MKKEVMIGISVVLSIGLLFSYVIMSPAQEDETSVVTILVRLSDLEKKIDKINMQIDSSEEKYSKEILSKLDNILENQRIIKEKLQQIRHRVK